MVQARSGKQFLPPPHVRRGEVQAGGFHTCLVLLITKKSVSPYCRNCLTVSLYCSTSSPLPPQNFHTAYHIRQAVKKIPHRPSAARAAAAQLITAQLITTINYYKVVNSG